MKKIRMKNSIYAEIALFAVKLKVNISINKLVFDSECENKFVNPTRSDSYSCGKNLT